MEITMPLFLHYFVFFEGVVLTAKIVPGFVFCIYECFHEEVLSRWLICSGFFLMILRGFSIYSYYR
eukprot:snap_masked-scaffold_33-processed-gene-0.35-mRNA-1 protein AED:1.00 eAED:1.00 QI:0/0/0/0/1/1/2/0/65